MRTATTLKISAQKKTIAVKWRDRAWYPRIVIRSAARDGTGFCEEDVLLVPAPGSVLQDGRSVKIRKLRRTATRSLDRIGGAFSNVRAPFLCARSGSLSGSRLNNPL
jgi:hypothetical protein